MTTPTSELLFAPEGALLRDPAEVDRALRELWGAGEPGAKEAATRVSVANLVVVAPAGQRNALLDTLAELSPMYPTRTIILLVALREEDMPEMKASVSAICHVPQDGQPQVCCEQLFVLCGPQHMDDMDHTLLPLLESDSPVMCWWRFGGTAWPALFGSLLAIARRIIVDELVREPCPPGGLCAIRDLGWYRTADIRELVAQLFDGCPPEVPASIEQVEIEAVGSAETGADSIWLAAFLAGQLDWSPVAAEPAVEGGDRGAWPGGLYRFRRAARTVQVHLTRRVDAECRRIQRVFVACPAGTFELQCHSMRANEYRITVCSSGVCQAPRSVQVPVPSLSRSLGSALVGRPVDLAFERARPVAEWLMRESGAPGAIR